MIAFRKIAGWETLVFSCFFCVLSVTGTAQKTAVDSMDRLILRAATDTGRLRLMGAKARIFAEINLDSSIRIARLTLDESVAAGYTTGELENRLSLASAYCFKGNYDSAARQLRLARSLSLETRDTARLGVVASTYGMLYGMQAKYDSSIIFFLESVHYSELKHDSAKLANDYRNISSSYQMQSKFSQALDYSQRSLRISEARKDLRNQAYLNLNIGMVYNGIFDTVRAERYWLKSIELAHGLNLVNVELYAATNISSLYIESGQFTKGYEYASRAVKLAHENGDIGMEATATARLATSLAGLKRLPEALPLARSAIRLAEQSRQSFNVYQTNSAYAYMLKEQEKYKEALPFLERAVAALKGSDLFDSQFAGTYQMLSTVYEKTGRYQEALAALRTAKQISDSIVSKENVRKTTEAALNFDFEKKEQATRLRQQQDQQTASNKQKILIAGLLITLLLAGAAYFAFNVKKKANGLLEDQKMALQSALSDLKATQAQLIESEKMASLGELTAGIAHEIQNPLNFVNNFSDVSVELLEELNAAIAAGERPEASQISADLAANLGKILHHGRRADGIVKGMLQHSRSSSDQKEFTDLNALADEYLRLSYHGLRAKNKAFNATLHTDFDPALDKTEVVPQDIGRVLLNLLTNAFYAIDEKHKMALSGYVPSVWISTKKTAGWVCISIRDNGNGIPEKIKDKLFQPFFTTKPAGQGTGLGLSLSYDIVKAHGGDINVQTAEGVGSEFILRLPYGPETGRG